MDKRTHGNVIVLENVALRPKEEVNNLFWRLCSDLPADRNYIFEQLTCGLKSKEKMQEESIISAEHAKDRRLRVEVFQRSIVLRSIEVEMSEITSRNLASVRLHRRPASVYCIA